MTGFLSWWDDFELWLAGLGFVVQTVLVMPVVLAASYGIALVCDAILGRGLGRGRALLRRARHADPTDQR